jgi:DHA2 family multidrug resistance protein
MSKISNLAYKWQVVISVVFGTFMVIMDATVVNVALPKFQQVFEGANLSATQWVISAYTLALGIVTPLSGFMADRYGIKKVYLLSLAAFVFGSFLCAIAPNLLFLIIARIIQGLGGGFTIPLGTALLFGAFPPQERGLAFGVFGIPLIVAPAMGPILGGFFVEFLDWRLIFLINIPIGILGVFMASKLLRESKGEGRQRFDFLGITFSTLGFGSILYGFSTAEASGWGSVPVISTLIVGAIFIILFCIVELTRPDGLVDLRLFKKPLFVIGNVIGWVGVISLFGAEFLLPLYLQILRGLTPTQTGLLLLPLALTAGVVVPFAGRFSDKFGARPIVVIGFGLLVINTWLLSNLTMDTSYWLIGLLLAMRGVALGMTVQASQQVALSVVEPRALPRASALSNASRQVFQALGVAILATIVTTVAGAKPEFGAGVSDPAVYQENFLNGLETAYYATFWVSLVAFAIAFFLPGWRPFQKKAVQPVPAEVPQRAEVLSGTNRNGEAA